MGVEGVGAGGSGSVGVEGVGAGRSGSVEVGAGRSGSVEVEGVGAGGSGSVEVEGVGGGVRRLRERGSRRVVMNVLPSTSEEAGTVANRQRLSAIGAMADEPGLLQYMALLLYGRLPTIFGLTKTDTAAVVGEVLHKNERTIKRWVDDFVSNGGEFSDCQQGHYVGNNTRGTV